MPAYGHNDISNEVCTYTLLWMHPNIPWWHNHISKFLNTMPVISKFSCSIKIYLHWRKCILSILVATVKPQMEDHSSMAFGADSHNGFYCTPPCWRLIYTARIWIFMGISLCVFNSQPCFKPHTIPTSSHATTVGPFHKAKGVAAFIASSNNSFLKQKDGKPIHTRILTKLPSDAPASTSKNRHL